MERKSVYSLFPFWCKFLGGLLMLAGSLGLYYFVYLGNKPNWLQFNAFTIYSKYIETRSFTFIKNNQGDELATFVYFIGALLIVFSKEKNEQAQVQQLKTNALSISMLMVTALFIIAYLFTHGMAIVFIAPALLYVAPLVYMVSFLILKRGTKG